MNFQLVRIQLYNMFDTSKNFNANLKPREVYTFHYT